MWNAIKGRKRCIIPVMGYYEWLKKSPKDKIPHFTKRADGKIMLLAGLWDSVQYEGMFLICAMGLMEGTEERIYSYTIITTSSAKSVNFLHDRMPVILEPRSEEMTKWLDPNEGWSMELANMLKPYEGKLEWYYHHEIVIDKSYPVKKEVGKVGEDSPLFIVPLDSVENKSNIANFFSKPNSPAKLKGTKTLVEVKAEDKNAGEDINSESHAPGKRKVEEMGQNIQIKEEASQAEKVKIVEDEMKAGPSPVRTAQRKPTKRAPPSKKKSPVKREGTSKITSFFGVK